MSVDIEAKVWTESTHLTQTMYLYYNQEEKQFIIDTEAKYEE